MTLEEAAGKSDASKVSRWESGSAPRTWKALDDYARRIGQPITITFGGKGKEALRPEWAEGLITKDDLEQMVAESLTPLVARQTVAALREAGLLPPAEPVLDSED